MSYTKGEDFQNAKVTVFGSSTQPEYSEVDLPGTTTNRNRFFIKYERFVTSLAKNATNETRVSVKTTEHAGKKGNPTVLRHWVDLREYWYANGPDQAPFPTGRGTMIPRMYFPMVAIETLFVLAQQCAGDDAFCARLEQFFNEVMEIRRNLPRDTDAKP